MIMWRGQECDVCGDLTRELVAIMSDHVKTEKELAEAIETTAFNNPTCAVYQNVVAKAVTDPSEIKKNLIDQLTSPVRWTQSVQAMIADGAKEFTEVGPGKVLQGLILKIDKTAKTNGIS